MSNFVEDELNSCVDVKAAQFHVQKLIRRDYLKQWKEHVQPGVGRKTRKKSKTSAQPLPAEPQAKRPSGVDAKFKSACKRCGVWGHYSNWKA